MAYYLDKNGRKVNYKPFPGAKRIPDPVTRNELTNKSSQVRQVSEAEKAESLAQFQQITKLFLETPPGSEQAGAIVSGFLSLAESVKPRGKKKDPTPSKVTNSVPGINTEDEPSSSDKTAIDQLTGKTSNSKTVTKHLIADGSPRGIETALRTHVSNNESVIRSAVKKANDVAKDPTVKEKMKDLGIPEYQFTGLVSKLSTNINTLLKENQNETVLTDVKKVAEKQAVELGNPFGSIDEKTGIRNPFGSMGVDFGNVLGNIAAQAKGIPAMKELGTKVPSSLDVSFPDIEIPDIITPDGFTNITGVTDLGAIMNSEPTTPVLDIGALNNKPPTEFLFTEVNSARELEIDLKSIRRKLFNVNITWTGSATDTRMSAKFYNDLIITAKTLQRAVFGNASAEKLGMWGHYYINKNGKVERVLNLEAFGSYDHIADAALKDEGNKILREGVCIVLDAGHEVPEGDKTDQTYGPKSITEAQWESIDMVMRVISRSYPGIEGISWDETTGNIGLGIGIPVSTLLINASPPRRTRPDDSLPNTDNYAKKVRDLRQISYDAKRGQYRALSASYSKVKYFQLSDLETAVDFSYTFYSRKEFTDKWGIDVLIGNQGDVVEPKIKFRSDDPRRT
jgi:hypothetical protein